MSVSAESLPFPDAFPRPADFRFPIPLVVPNSATPRYRLSPQGWAPLGSYINLFSNQGVEFEPVCGQHAATGLALHETGFISRRPHWNYQKVFSPFWRLYYDLEPGHKVIFAEKEFTMGPDRILLIPDHRLFHSQGNEPKPKLLIHFSREIRILPTLPVPILLSTATERSLLHDLVRVLRPARKPVDRDRVFHLSLALLHVVLSRPEVALAERGFGQFDGGGAIC